MSDTSTGESVRCPEGHVVRPDHWCRNTWWCDECSELIYRKDLRDKCSWCGEWSISATSRITVCNSCGHAHKRAAEELVA